MQTVVAESRREALRVGIDPYRAGAAAAWALGFAAPLYLAMRGGGYEAVLRDQVGIVVWWIVAAGVVCGALGTTRPSRAQLTVLGALVALAVWTGVGALWSQSSGRTMAEASRLSCYAAVAALAIVAVRAGAKDALIGGVASAIGLVAVLALLSRLHPAWFPANETAAFLPGALSRLNYPLNYWNGLAALVAMGVPLMVHLASSARTIAARMLAASAIPVMAAVVYLTFSRGGWLELGAAALVLAALSPGRVWRLATLTIGAAGGATLIVAVHQRPAIDHGLLSTAAGRQGGDELIAVALVVCVGVALLSGALALVQERVQARQALAVAPGWWTRGMAGRPAVRAAAVLVVVAGAVMVFVAAGGPHALTHAWQSFKSPALSVQSGQRNAEGRLLALSGEGRYQMWVSALHAFSSSPIGGIGAGTFQFWWAAHGSLFSYVINAHSLYFETLAETGAVGAALLALLLGAGLVGTLRRMRGAGAHARAQQAAIAASLVAFLAAAGADWVWQIPAIPVVFLLLVCAGAAGNARRGMVLEEEESPAGGARRPRARATGAWAVLAAVGMAAIAVPMASAVGVRSSQAQALQGQLGGALDSAKTAAGWQPYASEPALQQALVLEKAGSIEGAAREARLATSHANTDWQAWLVRSRIEAERGSTTGALAAWRRARALDPRDPLFGAKP